MGEEPTGIKEEVSDEQVEEVAKTFHEIYFNKLWNRAEEEGRAASRYNPKRDGWENFNDLHKESLRYTIKELIDSGMIQLGG